MSTIYEKAAESAVSLVSWVQDVIKVLKERTKEGNPEEYGSSFRTRARSFPELMESSGFLPACTFFYAKATEDAYERVCNLLDRGKVDASDVDNLLKMGKEKFGYAVFLHGTLSFLETSGLIRNHKNFLGSINELKEPGRLMLARDLIYPYLMELKKLSEALFKSERE
jgi:CRISPR type III-B/RAMP module-associated protein Cmr5